MLFTVSTAAILGLVSALTLTILGYIFILSNWKGSKSKNGFVRFLRDFFSFKKLFLEDVLKFFYVLATIGCVTVGFMLLFGYQENYRSYYNYDYWYGGYYDYYTVKESTAVIGLLTMFVGPVALRLGYEFLMMFVLLVKNVMEINNKLNVTAETPAAPQPVTYQAPVYPAYPPTYQPATYQSPVYQQASNYPQTQQAPYQTPPQG